MFCVVPPQKKSVYVKKSIRFSHLSLFLSFAWNYSATASWNALPVLPCLFLPQSGISYISQNSIPRNGANLHLCVNILETTQTGMWAMALLMLPGATEDHMWPDVTWCEERCSHVRSSGRFHHFTSLLKYALVHHYHSNQSGFTRLLMQDNVIWSQQPLLNISFDKQLNLDGGKVFVMQLIFFKYIIHLYLAYSLQSWCLIAKQKDAKLDCSVEMCLWAGVFLVSIQSLSEMPHRVSGCFRCPMVPDTLLISRAFLIK